MADIYSRADALREYLSGAAGDGGSQSDPAASFGGFRSSTEVTTYSIQVTNPLSGVTVNYASGVNQAGIGTLQAVDANTLKWKPSGASRYGAPTIISGTAVDAIVEGPDDPGQYLRVTATTPLSPDVSTITLGYVFNGFFSMPNVLPGDALAGIDHYRASVVKNRSGVPVTDFRRWIGLLGTPRATNAAQLGSSGAGVIQSTADFSDWPLTGWAQIRDSGGTLREVVYYGSRGANILNVIVRGCLGTTPAAGANTDIAYPVPGIGVAKDGTGVQAGGTGFQTIANANTAPAGVTWNLGITPAGGLSMGNLAAGQEVGMWIWREIPPGSMPQASALNRVIDSFNAY